MVAFARARTKSWLSKLWPVTVQKNNFETTALINSQDVFREQEKQKVKFLEATKNGGIWFS